MKLSFLPLALGLFAAAGPLAAADVRPPVAAHAHNDYEHPRPLADALSYGFASVEADVWLIDGRLLVAHDRKDTRPERTLEALYLDPLRARVRANGGRVHRDGPAFVLLVDVKSEARAAYAELERVLARYADLLTVFDGEAAHDGAVTVIVSGNRTREDVVARTLRRTALDGRGSDLDDPAPATLYPWISDNWSKVSAWRGEGPLPAADAAKVRDWVRRAHARGRKLRFWNTPETPAAWRELRAAGVDIVGTDRLAELAAFLRTP